MLTRISPQSLVRMALALTIAFPPSLHAKQASPEFKETIPAVIIPVQTKDGQQGQVRITTETPEQELRAIPAMTAADPSHFILAVTEKDSLFGVVAKSTRMDRLMTFVVGEANDFPLLKGEALPHSLRSIWRMQFQKLQRDLGKEKRGITVAVSIGAIKGAFIFHASSSIPQASQVAMAATALNGYQIVFANSWDKFMEFGGHGVLRTAETVNGVLAKAMSREAHVMSEREKMAYVTTGRFAMSMMLNTAVASYDLVSAGEYESLGQVAKFGGQGTTDISDAIVNDRARLGIVTERFAKNYGYFRAIFGAVGDVANYSDPHTIGPVLTTLALSTFMYSIFGRELETRFFMPKIVNPTRAFASSLQARVVPLRGRCELALSKFAAPRVAQNEAR